MPYAKTDRAVIRVRSNYRKGEEVCIYRLNAPFTKESFLEHVRMASELYESPQMTIRISPRKPGKACR